MAGDVYYFDREFCPPRLFRVGTHPSSLVLETEDGETWRESDVPRELLAITARACADREEASAILRRWRDARESKRRQGSDRRAGQVE